MEQRAVRSKCATRWPACRHHEHHLLRYYWATLCNLTGVCILCFSYIYQEQKRPGTCTIVRLTNKHVYYVLIHVCMCWYIKICCNIYREYFKKQSVCVVGVPVTFKTVVNLLSIVLTFVYPDLRVPTCCFSVRRDTGRHQLEVEPAVKSIVVSSTPVASRGVTPASSSSRSLGK